MKKAVLMMALTALFFGCSSKSGQSQTGGSQEAVADSLTGVSVKYATGFSVRDSADIRLVDVGDKYHFALVKPITIKYISKDF